MNINYIFYYFKNIVKIKNFSQQYNGQNTKEK